MTYEYLVFNIAVIVGPIVFSFDQKVHFIKRWKLALLSIVIIAIPFIAWDIAVSGIHWQFNPSYTIVITLLSLPLEEWLFFLTVPFACLFIWEILSRNNGQIISHKISNWVYAFLLILPLVGIAVVFTGKSYTATSLVVLGSVAFIDKIARTQILTQFRTYKFLSIVTILILAFNGYLTARPVVIYNEQYITGFRVFTIPVEDFFYGFALTLLTIILYERLKAWQGAKSEFASTSRTTHKEKAGILNE